MELTEVNWGKLRVDMTVKLVKVIMPPMEFKSLPEREVRLTAPTQDRSPLICWIPSREMGPVMVEPMDTAPLTVEHCDASAVASAWELMVAVG